MTTSARRGSAAAARRLRTQLTADTRPAPLSPELTGIVDGFLPRPPLAAQWPQLRPVVVEVLARSQIRGTDSFRKYLTHLGYFLAWAHGQGLPVAADTVVRHHTEEYTRVGMSDSSAKSRADRRARLRWLADQVNPQQTPDKGITVPRPTIKPPYSEPEMSQLVRVALTQPTAERSRKAALCIGLGAGAGLDSADLRGLRAAHIHDRGEDGVTIQVPGRTPRTVPVLARFEDLVRHGCNDMPRDALLLGRVEDRRNLAANALADVIVLGQCPRIEQSRLRSTWLATQLRAAVPLAALLQAAGLRSARTLPDLLPYLPPLHPADAERALRRGGSST